MAETAVETFTETNINVAKSKKKVASKKALKPKKVSDNEANILAGIASSPLSGSVLGKENEETLLLSGKKIKKASSKVKSSTEKSFEKELEILKAKFDQMKLEKEKTEEILKDRDEMLKLKEEELEIKGKEQQKLQVELKKLQKLKEFNPTVSLPLVQSLREKEAEKNEKNKKKKKKNPEMKKPSSAYVLWCKDQWAEVKKENPDAEFKEISNILGSKWKNVTEEEKKPYEEKYQADREAYLQIVGKEKRENEAMKLLEEDQKQKTAMELLEQYLQFKQEGAAEVKDGKKKKKEQDPLKPKRPLTAFFLFSKEVRANHADNKNVVEVSKIAGEEWKKMSEEQKKPYEDIVKKQKEEHLHEMELYNQKKAEEAEILRLEEDEQMKIHKQEALQMLKKKEKTENIIKKTKETQQKKKKLKGENSVVDPNKPKRPASSFLLFSKEARKNLVQDREGISNATINALISVKWKEMAEEDKKIWNDQAAEAMEAYKKELEEYNKSVAAANSSQA
ncbi:hypothetical protein C5167_047670 [Papaver somniferum]|uniref:HMG box domain-containing protein n=1 Tax=Papaver somniferum TaxID=3469 RepID=A0A4Y7LJV6_PAPSO|nr:high mobility group B protein 6-like [Papaver somniferum]RZC84890.1 hypothetical protein C5167_047670 [Papaver somniferum]